jgi:hypothetical protein
MDIKLADLLRAYARMLNTLNFARLAPALHPHFAYASQSVLSEIHGKKEFLDYIKPKLEAISRSTSPVFAEMGAISINGHEQPCVILAQGKKDNLVALALGQMRDDRLSRIDICVVPNPSSANRSGEYPV